MAPDLDLGKLFHALVCEISVFESLHPWNLLPQPFPKALLVVLHAEGELASSNLCCGLDPETPLEERVPWPVNQEPGGEPGTEG